MKFSISNQFKSELKAAITGYPKFVFARYPCDLVNQIPVFVYHTIDPNSFEAQLVFFKENGYRTLSINEFVDCIKRKNKLISKSVLITVDDGRSSFWRYGYPLLKKYEMRATLFIIPGRTLESYTCRDNLFQVWDNKSLLAEVDNIDSGDQTLCNWLEIKEMSESGVVDIESHTLFHKEVFVGSKLIDFITPNVSLSLFDSAITPYRNIEDVGLELDYENYYGFPIFESASLMQALPALKIPENVR